MRKISLIIPTRDRPDLFKRCIESWQTCTVHPENIELVVIVNDDDLASQEYVKKVLSQHRMFKQKILLRPYTQFINRDFYNWGADQAEGDLVWILGDDVLACGPMWDVHINNVIDSTFQKWPDGIFCLSIKDNTPVPRADMPKFPCYPMFPRQVREAHGGWYLVPTIPTWGVDFIIYKIYYGLERLVQIHDRNYLNHVSYHNHQVVQPDATNIRIGATFNLLKMRPEYSTDVYISNEVPKMIQMLQEKINNYGGVK